MKHTTMTAVSGRVGLAVLAAMLFASGAYAQNVDSSALNVGGQNNGKQSVSGVGNDQNVTGNNSTGIYNNAASNANGNTLKNTTAIANSERSNGNKSNAGVDDQLHHAVLSDALHRAERLCTRPRGRRR